MLQNHSDLDKQTLEEGRTKVDTLRSELLEVLERRIVKKLDDIGFPFDEQVLHPSPLIHSVGYSSILKRTQGFTAAFRGVGHSDAKGGGAGVDGASPGRTL